MGATKYVALTEHLKAQPKGIETVTLSFGQLKSILGFGLPSSALNHRPWWANHYGSHPQSRAWMDAGFVVESVNLESQLVRFSKKRGAIPNKAAGPVSPEHPRPPEQRRESSPALTQTEQECHFDLADLRATLVEVLKLAGCPLAPSDVQMHWAAAPHKRPSSLPAGTQAVYCFFLGTHCLKAGKAGPQSGPRFVSQHYHTNAPSTLAKSILAAKDRVASLLKEELKAALHSTDDQQIGKWIEKHTARLNVLIPAQAGPHTLSLVEAFLHCRFQPLFEGQG